MVVRKRGEEGIQLLLQRTRARASRPAPVSQSGPFRSSASAPMISSPSITATCLGTRKEGESNEGRKEGSEWKEWRLAVLRTALLDSK
jgi:hypothetical protein